MLRAPYCRRRRSAANVERRRRKLHTDLLLLNLLKAVHTIRARVRESSDDDNDLRVRVYCERPITELEQWATGLVSLLYVFSHFDAV